MSEFEGDPLESPKDEQSPYTEVTETLRLEPGRNFYDQYPFGDIIDEGAELYNKYTRNLSQEDTINWVRNTMTRLIGRAQITSNLDKGVSRLRTLLGKLDIVSIHPAHERDKYRYNISGLKDATLQCVEQLDNAAPEWRLYVATHLPFPREDNGLYELDGTSRGNVGLRIPPETYLAWSFDRQIRRGRQGQAYHILMLGETFPQTLQGQTIKDAVPHVGERSASRTWRIQRATGIPRTR